MEGVNLMAKASIKNVKKKQTIETPVEHITYEELSKELSKLRKRKRKKRSVYITRRNLDADFYYDMYKGDAFVITEPGEVTLDGNRKKSLYGPQSPLYGTSYEDEQAFVERYRCECGEFKSRQFEGEICPKCGTPVEYRDSNINITGWISFGNNRIISPLYYQLFSSAIGKNIFPDIIFARYKITTDGKRVRPTAEDLNEEPLSIYSGVGVDVFYDKYEEILNYFANQKKNKKRTFDILLMQKDRAFTSHIPIPSTMLRPQSITAETYYYQTVDKLINSLFSISENLKTCDNIERDYILHRLQTKVNEMWSVYFDELNGKSGFIRDKILGGSLEYWVNENLFNCWDILRAS